MNAFKRVAAGILAGAMLLSFSGCSEEEESSASDAADAIGDMAQEDMPYGATITLLKEISGKVQAGIEYDKRFITEEEAIKISNYVAALGSADDELMREAVYEGYLDTFAEEAGCADLKEYLEVGYDTLKSDYIGEDFLFNYVLVNDCVDETDVNNAGRFTSMDENIQSIYGDLNITDKKMVTVEMMYTHPTDGGSYSFSRKQNADTILFIYTIDGEPYIFL